MNHKKILPTDEKLNKVKSKFKTWRTIRKSRKPIPSKLWDEATDLYPEYSIHKISKELSLNYTDLKNRVQQKPGDLFVKQVEVNPAFIELGFSPVSSPVAECVVEMEDINGAKMRMCFSGKTDFDLLELGKSFWSRKS